MQLNSQKSHMHLLKKVDVYLISRRTLITYQLKNKVLSNACTLALFTIQMYIGLVVHFLVQIIC